MIGVTVTKLALTCCQICYDWYQICLTKTKGLILFQNICLQPIVKLTLYKVVSYSIYSRIITIIVNALIVFFSFAIFSPSIIIFREFYHFGSVNSSFIFLRINNSCRILDPFETSRKYWFLNYRSHQKTLSSIKH